MIGFVFAEITASVVGSLWRGGVRQGKGPGVGWKVLISIVF